MTIPTDWLVGPMTIREVEEQLATEWAPDVWLEQWRILLSHAGPHDELWEYFAVVVDDPASEDWDLSDVQSGYALVRDGEVVDAISTAALPWA
jgi:hypothetical protein